MPSVNAQIARAVLDALAGGEPVITATVVRASGESVPGLGAKLLVRGDGSTVGSLGGGALEEAARQACLAQLRRHGTRLLRLDVAGAEVTDRHQESACDVLIEVVEQPPV